MLATQPGTKNREEVKKGAIQRKQLEEREIDFWFGEWRTQYASWATLEEDSTVIDTIWAS